MGPQIGPKPSGDLRGTFGEPSGTFGEPSGNLRGPSGDLRGTFRRAFKPWNSLEAPPQKNGAKKQQTCPPNKFFSQKMHKKLFWAAERNSDFFRAQIGLVPIARSARSFLSRKKSKCRRGLGRGRQNRRGVGWVWGGLGWVGASWDGVGVEVGMGWVWGGCGVGWVCGVCGVGCGVWVVRCGDVRCEVWGVLFRCSRSSV